MDNSRKAGTIWAKAQREEPGLPRELLRAPCCPLVPSSKGSAPTPEGEFMAATAPNPALSVTSVRTRSLGDYIFKAQIVLFVSLPAFMRPSVILHTDNISYVH